MGHTDLDLFWEDTTAIHHHKKTGLELENATGDSQTTVVHYHKK